VHGGVCVRAARPLRVFARGQLRGAQGWGPAGCGAQGACVHTSCPLRWCWGAGHCWQALSPNGQQLLLSVPTSLTANATRGSFAMWPVVSVYNSFGLPALPWGPTPLA
jgi:hypothetical protein